MVIPHDSQMGILPPVAEAMLRASPRLPTFILRGPVGILGSHELDTGGPPGELRDTTQGVRTNYTHHFIFIGKHSLYSHPGG